MKRRELFKMLATLAAVPFAAPLAALCRPKPKISLNGRILNTEWGNGLESDSLRECRKHLTEGMTAISMSVRLSDLPENVRLQISNLMGVKS